MRLEKQLSQRQLISAIEKLIEWDALEFSVDPKSKKLWIPYLMNDAVEQYLLLEGCSVRGILETDEILDTEVEGIEEADAKGLILRQPSGNMITIWYRKVTETIACYQYHQIGHAWRKQPGEEFIRRLVNLLCVLHDKRNYLGVQYCSKEECFLADLAEFPPILYFTPINEAILDWYPATQQGILAVRMLAEEAADPALLDAIAAYESAFIRHKIKEKQIKNIAQQLLKEEHRILWELMEQKIRNASAQLPQRDYGEATNRMIARMRQLAEKKYAKEGFQGSYPKMRKEERVKDRQQIEEIWFVEEQPFTVLEWEDYRFRIFSVRVTNRDYKNCVWKEEVRNNETEA